MNPLPQLAEEHIKQHNALYDRANALMEGLLILDGIQKKRLGFFQKRRLKKAIRLHQEVLAINPANWPSMFAIGKAFQSLGDLEQALSWFAKANERVPDNPSVAKEIGHAAGRLGKHDVAVHAMGAVISQHPNNAGLQINFGLSCLMAGRITEACNAFEKAVELEPQRELNRKLLSLAKDVASGKRARPDTEQQIIKAIETM